MAISDETGQENSVTELRPALKLFTDRHEAIRLFSAYLNDDPPRERILFFYGDGGNGKTLLLNYLRYHYCKRLHPDNWEYVKALSDEDFHENFQRTEGAKSIPTSLIDFGATVGDNRPQQEFFALLKMRRDLANHGLRFPLFDFACIWYLHKTGNLTDEKRKSLFPAEEMDLIAEMVDAIGNTSWGAIGKVFLNVFSKRSKNWFTLYRQRIGLDEEKVKAIQEMDPESELVVQLPRLFAEDLSVTMALDAALERVVLFFDTHEAFWGTEKRNLSRDAFFRRDEWLRYLIQTLKRTAGIVVVMAGRDRPRWAEASKYKISGELIDIQLVGHLSEVDAAHYLERAGISDTEMRETLIACARVAPDQVHPFYLGLCIDIIEAATKKGTPLTPKAFRSVPQAVDKENELMDRLLRYVDEEVHYAIRALSACRAFNREIYFKLGAELVFHATEPSFHLLTRFSFVWQTTHRGDGWYRIHDLLRRLMREQKDEVVGRADVVLEKYYQERGKAGEAASIAEAIYHANQMEPEQGVAQWSTTFDEAIKSGRLELCRALFDVRNELLIQTEFERGMVSSNEAQYYLTLSRHDEAREELREALASFDEALRLEPDKPGIHNNKGLTLASFGDFHTQLSQYEEATVNYKEALASMDEALRLGPDAAESHSNKGLVLQALGRMLTLQSRYEEAEARYKEAAISYEEALRLSPDLALAYYQKGMALQFLGYIQEQQSKYEQAIASYKESLPPFDRALQLAPSHIYINLGKGVTLTSMGRVLSQQSRHDEVIASCTEALISFDEALNLAPDHPAAHYCKAGALLTCAESQTALSNYVEAAESYKKAVISYDEALRLTPGNAMAHQEKGLAFRDIGNLQLLQSKEREAIESCNAALRSLDEALRLAPNLTFAHVTKGTALITRGDAHGQLSLYEEAMASYEEALISFDAALNLTPDFATALNNKSLALRNMGVLQELESNYEGAAESYKAALIPLGKALQLAPDLAMAHQNVGLAYLSLGQAQMFLSQYEEAAETYAQALISIDEALQLAPDLAIAHANKGAVFRGIGHLQVLESKYEEAIESLEKSLRSCDEALRLAPNFVYAHDMKGRALFLLGASQAEIQEREAALKSFEAALAALSRCLEIAPGNISSQEFKEQVQEQINDLSKT